MEEQLKELTKKVTELERKLYGYKIGIIIFGTALSMFMYFQWNKIPEQAEKAVRSKLFEEVKKSIKQVALESKIIISAVEKMRSRGDNNTTVITKGEFWNLNTVNTVGHTCPNGQFLTGLDFDMIGINDVRTPTKITYYCAPKLREP